MPATDSTLMVAIIGAGAAGMSCALWLKHLGFMPVIIDRNAQPGGQLLSLNRVNRWVLGAIDKTGTELAELYVRHIYRENIKVFCRSRLTAASSNTGGFNLVIETDGKSSALTVCAVVIATGVRPIGAEMFNGIPGFEPLHQAQRISFFPLDHLDATDRMLDKTIAIIGGGNNAFYTAIDAATAGANVYLLIRSRPKARMAVQNQAQEFTGITPLKGIKVTAFEQKDEKIAIVLVNETQEWRIIVDTVFVRAGFAPNSDFLDALGAFSRIAKDRGYIKTDPGQRTSIPWVYAIGDVANSKHQSVVGAIAEGAFAAQDLAERI